jgi:hypothetical protein
VLVLFGAADASAYCRTRTCQLNAKAACTRDEATGCYSEGVAVYWSGDCLSYAIQRDGSLAQGISAEQVARLVEAGFRAWSDALCDAGGTPPLSALSQGSIACDAAEFNCQKPGENTNLILFRDDFESTDTFRFGVIALTTLTANIRTGQIFDADIEINSRDEEFVIDPPSADGAARDLRGVINHELGHLLGLSHPNVNSALMYADYQGTVLPAEDDAAGLCAIRGSKRSDPQCDVVTLPADTACLGQDVSCKTSQQVQQEMDSGCALGAPAAPGRGLAAQKPRDRGAWAGALFRACWLRRRRTAATASRCNTARAACRRARRCYRVPGSAV